MFEEFAMTEAIMADDLDYVKKYIEDNPDEISISYFVSAAKDNKTSIVNYFIDNKSTYIGCSKNIVLAYAISNNNKDLLIKLILDDRIEIELEDNKILNYYLFSNNNIDWEIVKLMWTKKAEEISRNKNTLQYKFIKTKLNAINF